MMYIKDWKICMQTQTRNHNVEKITYKISNKPSLFEQFSLESLKKKKKRKTNL